VNLPNELPDVRQDALAMAKRALAEDGSTDITSEVVGAAGVAATGIVEYRSGGVVAGSAYADAVVQLCFCGELEWQKRDGETVGPGTILATLDGDLAQMLLAERTLLNFLQRACGIATATRAFVDALAGTGCRVLHTRKTAPGLRVLDVHAVLAGGGGLHRFSLSSAVLVKDNHWHVLGRDGINLRAACDLARGQGVAGIYVEVENLEQVNRACDAGATRLLIDNQSPAEFKRLAAVARAADSKIEIEATGGMTLETARDYAESGADFVSVGALTHSVIAADVALEISARN
jgi:nicotinate-nucleotide pyrophosphorylase (carboxylating)